MTAKPIKNGRKSVATTQFAPGNPGGPGRPEGSRNKATLLLDQLADGSAQAILERVVENAKSGDSKAAELILSRVWPIRKGRRITLQLPPIISSSDIMAALSTVLKATTDGELTPDEAVLVASLLETKRKAIETVDLEARLTKLETLRKGGNL